MYGAIHSRRAFWRRNGDKDGTLPDSFYWDTFGIMPEEMILVRR